MKPRYEIHTAYLIVAMALVAFAVATIAGAAYVIWDARI